MLEAALLLGLLGILQLTGASSMTFIVLLILATIVCLPLLRMATMKAPPFIPTPKRHVRTMATLADIRPGDRAYDLGCGDGRVVRAAAALGAKATGFELSLPTYALAKILTVFRPNADIRYGNFWKHDYRDADVIFCFLLIETMEEFRAKIWPSLKPGCRVVSYVFQPKGMTPAKKEGNVYVYVK